MNSGIHVTNNGSNPQNANNDNSRFGESDASTNPISSSTATGLTKHSASSTIPTSSDRDTQYGRDAAVAGGAGATGLGAYEASKHYDSSKVPSSNTEIYGSDLTHPTQKNEPTSAQSSNTAGYGSSATNPISSSYPTSSTAQSLTNPMGSPERDSHFGRDTTIAGGAGATGLGAYEASKHHDQKQSAPTTQSSNSDGYGSAKVYPTTTTRSTVRSSDANAPSQAIGSTSSKDHEPHYGRDAALAGGAGAVGLGAYEAKKHHDAPTTGTSQTSQPIHQSTAQKLGPGAALGTGSRDASSGSGISSTSRPDTASIASNASIKSGVLGRVPTSELTKGSADANLPAISATGGKFMEGTSSYPSQAPSQSTT
jgi:hypothetical protein